jgi:HJR/Mrr/RecB family endonuclease
MSSRKRPFTGAAHVLNFAALSADDFERLCLWLVEREGFEDVEHLGLSGNEQGRDIVGKRDGRTWAFQCKRVTSLGPTEAEAEVRKVKSLPRAEQPDCLAASSFPLDYEQLRETGGGI